MTMSIGLAINSRLEKATPTATPPVSPSFSSFGGFSSEGAEQTMPRYLCHDDPCRYASPSPYNMV